MITSEQVTEAARRRDNAILAVAVASGQEWQDRAFAALMLHSQRYADFIMEEARAEAHAAGLPYPGDLRAWGAVTNRAARMGAIEKTGGYRLAASSNLSPKPIWRATVH